MKTIGYQQAKGKYKKSIIAGDIVKVPDEKGNVTGKVRRTKTGYIYNWIYVEWPDGEISEHIVSKVEKIPLEEL